MTNRFHRSPSVGLYCIELRTAPGLGAGRAVVSRSARPAGAGAVPEDGYALFEAGETRLAILARHAPGDASPRWSLGFEVDSLEAVIGRLRATGAESAHPHGNAEGFHEVMTEDATAITLRLFAWPERG